jgi:hypothetical protein
MNDASRALSRYLLEVRELLNESQKDLPDNVLQRAVELLRAGADVNVRADGGATPLHHAAAMGSRNLCRLFLEHGADPGARTTLGLTTAETAIINEHRDALTEILRACQELPPTVSKKALVEMCFTAPFCAEFAQTLIDLGLGSPLRAYARKHQLRSHLPVIQSLIVRKSAADTLRRITSPPPPEDLFS